MQGYYKGSLGHSIKVHYNGPVEASMQGYSNGSVGPIIVVRNND
jgi:hypothetical protein